MVLKTLNEAQARLFAAQKALEIGRGGISRVAELTGMSRPTIYKGIADLEGGPAVREAEPSRIRRAGAGRKKVEDLEPAVRERLTQILEETTARDPMSLLKWTNKSTRRIGDELTAAGHPMTAPTVAR